MPCMNSYVCAYLSCKYPLKSRVALAFLYTWRWDMYYHTDDLRNENKTGTDENYKSVQKPKDFFLIMIQWSTFCDTVFPLQIHYKIKNYKQLPHYIYKLDILYIQIYMSNIWTNLIFLNILASNLSFFLKPCSNMFLS